MSALEGTRWGRGAMVRTTLMDMYRELHNISGGAETATTFRDVPQEIATDGLCGPDDDLYDDSTPVPPKKPCQGVPEQVAAKGLGRAGRVSLARTSLGSGQWHRRTIWRMWAFNLVLAHGKNL